MLKRIQECAYFKWLNAGKPGGQDNEFWLEAEQEVRNQNKIVNRGLWLKQEEADVLNEAIKIVMLKKTVLLRKPMIKKIILATALTFWAILIYIACYILLFK